MSTSCRFMSCTVLTGGGLFANVKTPNYVSHNRRPPRAPHGGKVLSASSAIFRAPAGLVSGGRRVSIGRPATSSIREDWRLHIGRGALLGLPLFLIPENYVRFPLCP